MDDMGPKCCNGDCQRDDSCYQDQVGNWLCGFCLLDEHNAALGKRLESYCEETLYAEEEAESDL